MEHVVKIGPVALISIVDNYERRTDVNSRVIGTLLGYSDNQTIYITNSFAVPHTENDEEVCVEIEFNLSMVALSQKVNPSEKVVGWYSTGTEITDHSKLVHEEYYRKMCKKQCVFLLVDTTMQTDEFPFKAYMSKSIGIPDKSSGMMFVPIPIEMHVRDAESTALRMMSEGLNNKRRHVYMKDDLTNLIDVSKNVLTMLRAVMNYVNDVLNNKATPDPQIGRKLSRILLAIPKIDKDLLNKLISSSSNDFLMYAYLCMMIKTEMKITEKMLSYGY